jgi:hypothetical protein
MVVFHQPRERKGTTLRGQYTTRTGAQPVGCPRRGRHVRRYVSMRKTAVAKESKIKMKIKIRKRIKSKSRAGRASDCPSYS